MLTRMYGSPGGPEILDVLMKYLYVADRGTAVSPLSSAWPCSYFRIRYKGMSGTSATLSKVISPQPTGFSQIHSRGGGEGGGQAMSVLLSWHEKLVEITGPGSIVRVMTDRRTV